MSTDARWLDSYASDRYDWHVDGDNVYYRRIGIVESLFNTDGTDFEGRADLSIHLHVEAKTRLSNTALRARVLLAWSVLRQKHTLLSARVVEGSSLQHVNDNSRCYVFHVPRDSSTMLTEAAKHATFLEDHYVEVDVHDFFVHTLNTGRCIDESQALSRLYVIPAKHDQMHFVLIAGHEIVDGLTSLRWMASFIDLLNLSSDQLESEAQRLCSSSPVSRLPPPQEALYPPMKGPRARQRWSWLISRILRHVHRPAPESFQNPLRRSSRLRRSVSMESRFHSILDYSKTPPLNTFPVRAILSPAATRRISKLCREAKISVGSGCFALVAIIMMLFEERRHPDVPLHKRLPFVGSFPVNPRPFLSGESTTGKEDSLMLAFSDGISLPFLASDLELEGKIRLLGKQAHRQLRQYQKRPRNMKEDLHLGSRSPNQLLPLLYLNTMEGRSNAAQKRRWDLQGAYRPKVSSTLATCGVSSVGARGSVLSQGKYDTSTELPEHVDLRVDLRAQEASVRARDGEFLVGVVGDEDVLRFGVSYDGCAIDPELARQWKHVVENILEEPADPKSGSKDETRTHKL